MITTGVLGRRWRASITPWGAIEPWSDGPTLDWYIAADDRWHVPRDEPAVRQHRVDGTAVVVTRVRVPDGDVVQTIYSAADHGGLTLIEIENASPLPVVVAFSHGRLCSARPPSSTIEGIDLPSGSVAFPIGHRATLTVALAHDGRRGTLPSPVPTAAGVARGWSSIIDRAGRVILPDERIAPRLASHRCELALCGPTPSVQDQVAFLLDVAALVRMGEEPGPWLDDVADAAEGVVRRPSSGWDAAAALDGAASVFGAAGQTRALRDLAAARRRRPADRTLPRDEPIGDESRRTAWHERRLVSAGDHDSAVLLPLGLPSSWLGANFEVYAVPVVSIDGATTQVSFAVRWHGERPAVLWEQTGPVLALTSPMQPEWRTEAARGETLWGAPGDVSDG